MITELKTRKIIIAIFRLDASTRLSKSTIVEFQMNGVFGAIALRVEFKVLVAHGMRFNTCISNKKNRV